MSIVECNSLDCQLIMKAVNPKTNEIMYVMDIRDNDDNIIKYVSDTESFYPYELKIINEE